MSKNVRVNITTLANSKAIRNETLNGRKVIIVPSATLPDGVVMNRVRYPAKAIESSFHTLENTPAPLGHPDLNGEFVSASDPQGIIRGFIGAWNKNVRRQNGRVYLDKVIDVEYANQSEGGRSVLEAIDKGEPIHTSTGLFAKVNALQNDSDADWEVEEMVFDHDAILIGESGAATPEKGVGIFVNKALDKDQKPIDLINSYLSDEADRELDWAAEYALRAAEKLQKAPLLDRIKQAIKEAVAGVSPAPETSTTEGEQAMNDAQFNDLSGKLDLVAKGLETMATSIAETITNAMKPLAETLANQAAAAEAEAKVKKEQLVNKVAESGLLAKEVAEAATVEVLEALANTIKPKALGVSMLNTNKAGSEGDKPAFLLPSAE